jgi:hypothetical protein
MVLSSVQVRSARAVEDLQRKELEDQLEAEAYFSGLYKTQVLPATASRIFIRFRINDMYRLDEGVVWGFPRLGANG